MSRKHRRIPKYQVEGQVHREIPNVPKGAVSEVKVPIADVATLQGEFPTEWQDLVRFIPFMIAMFVVYVATLAPTVPGGDSGELISVAYNLGVAHPPGYPLYTLLGHLFTYLPFGSVAWRVNLFSAVTTVATAGMIFLVVNRWLRNYWAAAFAATMFCLSPLTWRYALVAEVFALSNFFVAALLYVTLRFYEDPKEKWAFAWAGTLGLACSHHHTIILVAAPIFIMCLIKAPRLLLSFRVLTGSMGVFVLGFLPYAYIPWASTKRLMLSWGETDNWDGFWLHFLRKEYGTFQLATGDTNYDNVLFNNYKYLRELTMQFLIVGMIPLAAGLWLQFRKSVSRWKDFGWMMVVASVAYLIVFHTLANMDVNNRLFYDVQSRFWMLPNIFMSVFAAVGLIWLWKNWMEARPYFLPAAAILTGVLQVGIHYRSEDMSRNTVFYDMGKSTLEPLAPNSMYLMRGDVYVNAVRYLQDCEHFRKDVAAIPFDLLWWPWMKKVVETNFKNVVIPGKVYRYQTRRNGDFVLSELVRANIDRMDVYIGKLRDDEQQLVDPIYNMWNIGFIYKFLPKGKDYVYEDFLRDSKPFETLPIPTKDEIRDKSWEAFVFYNFWDREIDRSRQVFAHAMKLGADDLWLKEGAKILERVVADYPAPPGHTYRNLGVAYQFLGKKEPQYIPRMVEMWEKYLSMNPQGDSEIEGIKMLVAQNRAMMNQQAIQQQQQALQQQQQRMQQQGVPQPEPQIQIKDRAPSQTQ